MGSNEANEIKGSPGVDPQTDELLGWSEVGMNVCHK